MDWAPIAVGGLALLGTLANSYRQFKSEKAKAKARAEEVAASTAPDVIQTSLHGWRTLTDRLDQEIRRRERVELELERKVFRLQADHEECERRAQKSLGRVLRLESIVKQLGGTVP